MRVIPSIHKLTPGEVHFEISDAVKRWWEGW